MSFVDGRVGHKAVVQVNTSSMAALGCKAIKKTARNPDPKDPLSAEAASKRKISGVGGKYDLNFNWHVTGVGLEVLNADDYLPMWCAVPRNQNQASFDAASARSGRSD